ncbi:MAG: lasso peptide biosynthesis B2 protein [Caldilineaceae bacterium]
MAKADLFTYAHLRAAWQKRSWRERQLVVEAFCWLGLARLLVLTLPFHWLLLLLRLQRRPVQTRLGAPVAHQPVEQIRRAVQAVSGYTPWTSNCLAQALAANRMLHRRRLPSILYIGVAKQHNQPLTAHAWLCCGERFVTGEAGWQQFTPITCLTSGNFD